MEERVKKESKNIWENDLLGWIFKHSNLSKEQILDWILSYETSRKLRVVIIHGMARMVAIMASTYKAYLGVGLGPLSFLTKFRIPHPKRVGGRVFIDKAMPLMLSWVLGGNNSKLEGKPPSCRLSDKVKMVELWMRAVKDQVDDMLWQGCKMQFDKNQSTHTKLKMLKVF